jgi:hypothetical protein
MLYPMFMIGPVRALIYGLFHVISCCVAPCATADPPSGPRFAGFSPSSAQWAALAMWTLHYFKREMETFFVHLFYPGMHCWAGMSLAAHGSGRLWLTDNRLSIWVSDHALQ